MRFDQWTAPGRGSGIGSVREVHVSVSIFPAEGKFQGSIIELLLVEVSGGRVEKGVTFAVGCGVPSGRVYIEIHTYTTASACLFLSSQI